MFWVRFLFEAIKLFSFDSFQLAECDVELCSQQATLGFYRSEIKHLLRLYIVLFIEKKP